YSLLRHFADGGRVKIGVCWMLTPDDHGPDGRKTAYLSNPEDWRAHDPELFDLLERLVLGGDLRRSTDSISRTSGEWISDPFTSALPRAHTSRKASVLFQ